MDKDLLKFENRSDDWLAKQKRQEDSVSAWDIDEGRKLRQEHRNDCEAREIKLDHERKHRAYNNAQILSNKDVGAKRFVAKNLIVAFSVMALVIVVGLVASFIPKAEIYLSFIPLGIVMLSFLILTKRRK